MSSTPPPAALQYLVFSLADVLKPAYSSLGQRVSESLNAFSCARSSHIQAFARSKVTAAEQRGDSRTYVMLVEDPSDSRIEVGAFFTVGLVNISFEMASNTKKRKLTGSTTRDHAGAYLIAELGRSDRYSSEQLPGPVILDEAKQVITRARGLVAGRYVVVDSQPIVFERLYQPAGFIAIDIAKPPRGMEGVEFVTSCCDARAWCS